MAKFVLDLVMEEDSGEAYLSALESSNNPKDRELAAKIRQSQQMSVVPNPAEQLDDRLKMATKGSQRTTQSVGSVYSGAGTGQHREGAQRPISKEGINYVKQVNEARS